MKKRIDEKIVSRAAIYCRVSTIGQDELEYSSLDVQEDQLKAYCKGKGWTVVKVYRDIKSGKNLERDEIQQLLKDAEDDLFDIVVATKIDRFSRSILAFYELSEKLSLLGVGIASATQPIETSSSAGRLMLDIFLAFAQFERNIISERTIEAMYSRAVKGIYTGGHVILGYDNIDKELKINNEEIDLVNRIFNYYLNEPSTNSVSKRLNQEGFKTKSIITKKGKVKGGKYFTKQDVLRTLKNKTYIGLVAYKDKYFTGIHEAIVEQKLFDDVQNRLEKSQKDIQVTRKVKSPLTLLGITKCGLCGSNLTTSSTKKGKIFYYKCSKKAHATSTHCPAKDLSADILEKCIRDLMISIVSDDEFFEAIYDQVKFNNNEEISQLENDLKILRTNKSKLESQRANILEAIKSGSKLKTIKSVQDELEKMEGDITLISITVSSKERELDLATNKRISKTVLKNLLKDYSTIYDELPQDDKIRLNHLLFVDITSYFNKNDDDGKIVIKIRGDGKLEKSWKTIKNANMLTTVRTSDTLGSASKTRTCNPPVNSRMLHH